MAKIVLPYQLDSGPRSVPDTPFSERLKWFVACLAGGLKRTIKPASLITLIAGGSLVAYLGLARDLGPGFIAALVTAIVLFVFILGAEEYFFKAHRAAWAYAPTWQKMQARADTLRVIAEPEGGFRSRYSNHQMIAARADFDRAVASGFTPNFSRERIPDVEYGDVEDLIAAFDDVVNRWQKAELKIGGSGV